MDKSLQQKIEAEIATEFALFLENENNDVNDFKSNVLEKYRKELNIDLQLEIEDLSKYQYEIKVCQR